MLLNKKAQWTKVIIIIIAIFGGLMLLMVLGMWIGTIQVGFHDALCKFNLFVRHLALGNPITVLGSQLGSMFKIVPPSIPVPCTTNKWQVADKESDFINNNTLFLKLLAEEVKRCWDIFGLGSWNSLIFAPTNVFPCFEDSINVNITGSVTHLDLKEYMDFNEILAVGKLHKTYSQFIPWDNIMVLNETSGRMFYFKETEDGEPQTYFVSVYFADYYKVGMGFISLRGSGDIISTACGIFKLTEKAADTVVLCIR